MHKYYTYRQGLVTCDVFDNKQTSLYLGLQYLRLIKVGGVL